MPLTFCELVCSTVSLPAKRSGSKLVIELRHSCQHADGLIPYTGNKYKEEKGVAVGVQRGLEKGSEQNDNGT